MQILVKTDFQVSCYCKILNVSDHCRFLFKHQGFPWVGGVKGWPKRTFLPKTWSLVSSATWDGLWRHIIAIIFSTKPAIGKLIWHYGYIAHIHDNQWLDKVKNHAWPNQKWEQAGAQIRIRSLFELMQHCETHRIPQKPAEACKSSKEPTEAHRNLQELKGATGAYRRQQDLRGARKSLQ